MIIFPAQRPSTACLTPRHMFFTIYQSHCSTIITLPAFDHVYILHFRNMDKQNREVVVVVVVVIAEYL